MTTRKTVFDTNILIDALNGLPQARRYLMQDDSEKHISIISYIEAFVGSPSSEENLKRTLLFLNQFQLAQLNMDVAHRTIGVRRKHRFKLPDAILYATAEHLQAQLISRNTKDFKPTMPLVCVPYTLH